MAYSAFEKDFFRANGRLPDAGEIARGNLTVRADTALVETIVHDELTGALHHRTFAYAKPDSPKFWMDPYRAIPQRQLFINRNGKDRDWCEARGQQMLRDEQALAEQIAAGGIESVYARIEI